MLNAVPDIRMLDYLPEFLDGLFQMLSDVNKEIQQAADNALQDFLREIKHAEVSCCAVVCCAVCCIALCSVLGGMKCRAL